MYTPSKTELALLKLVHSEGALYNGKKSFDSAKAQEKLNMQSEDKTFLLDMRLVRFDGQRVLITLEGKNFIEHYFYFRLKEYAFWISVIAAVLAAVFSVLSFFLD